MNKKGQNVERAVDSMLREWKRGMLSFWTLGLLLIRPMYGLEIMDEIETSSQGRMSVGPGTIYQLLRRLEKRGLVESRQERTRMGPPRTYYELTPAGRAVLSRYAAEVLSPESAIAQALGQVTAAIFQELA